MLSIIIFHVKHAFIAKFIAMFWACLKAFSFLFSMNRHEFTTTICSKMSRSIGLGSQIQCIMSKLGENIHC